MRKKIEETIKTLTAQHEAEQSEIQKMEAEINRRKANLLMSSGAIQVLRHLIASEPEPPAAPAPVPFPPTE